MAGCKLTKSLEDKACRYSVAGARALYLANYYPPTEDTTATGNVIKYTRNSDGLITNITLPADEKVLQNKRFRKYDKFFRRFIGGW